MGGLIFALDEGVLSPYRINHHPLDDREVEPPSPDGIILLILIVVLLLTYKFS